MSQLQSEVRPLVKPMPMSGFRLQTGGSARRRIIKPTHKLASTDQFPIQNEYRVSGVPGHTHNSSAVASVLLPDLLHPEMPITMLRPLTGHDMAGAGGKRLCALARPWCSP